VGRYFDWKKKVFCAYAYLDVEGRPYYVGVGSWRRPYVKHSNVQKPTDKSRILVVPTISKEEAVAMELLLIRHWARTEEGGVLLNRTKGGAGLREPSEEVRRKISERKKSEPRTPEWSARLVDSNEWRTRKDLWIAPDGTTQHTYPREIIRRHPESGLNLRSLQRVRSGLHENHKGWRCARTLVLVPRKIKGQLRVWFHPDHGEVVASTSDLSVRYVLSSGHLSSVANGARKSHKGWVFRGVFSPLIPSAQQPERPCA
jgi:hypothetical protein